MERNSRNETLVYKKTQVFPLQIMSEDRRGDVTSWGKYTEERGLKIV